MNVVMFSGGITSWAAARRVADKHGTDDLVLLFADTLAEDEDLHRFLYDAARDIGVTITRVSDGRTPQQVHQDVRLIGNPMIAPCSRVLKQEPCRRWIEANTDPATTTLHVGIDWSEMHRLPAIERAWSPWPVTAPMCRPPYVDKRMLIDTARLRGIEPPRLYALGFEHNNCGGACVRGGQAQWAHLLRVFPDRFASWEAHEQEMRDLLGTAACRGVTAVGMVTSSSTTSAAGCSSPASGAGRGRRARTVCATPPIWCTSSGRRAASRLRTAAGSGPTSATLSNVRRDPGVACGSDPPHRPPHDPPPTYPPLHPHQMVEMTR